MRAGCGVSIPTIDVQHNISKQSLSCALLAEEFTRCLYSSAQQALKPNLCSMLQVRLRILSLTRRGEVEDQLRPRRKIVSIAGL